MKLNVQLTGIAKEITGKEQITLEVENQDKFYIALIKEIPELKNYYYAVSINGTMARNFSNLNPEDKILVFSPAAGG